MWRTTLRAPARKATRVIEGERSMDAEVRIDAQACVRALPLPALLLDARGTLLAANDLAESLLGVTAAMIGAHATELPLLQRVPELGERVASAAQGAAAAPLAVRSSTTVHGVR